MGGGQGPCRVRCILPLGFVVTGEFESMLVSPLETAECNFAGIAFMLRNRSIPKVVVPNQIGLMQFWWLFGFHCSDHFFHFRLATKLYECIC